MLQGDSEGIGLLQKGISKPEIPVVGFKRLWFEFCLHKKLRRLLLPESLRSKQMLLLFFNFFFCKSVFFSFDSIQVFPSLRVHVTLKHQKLCKLVRAPHESAHFFI